MVRKLGERLQRDLPVVLERLPLGRDVARLVEWKVEEPAQEAIGLGQRSPGLQTLLVTRGKLLVERCELIDVSFAPGSRTGVQVPASF